MTATQHASLISEQEYLDDEKISPVKYEYVDGHVYAMAGAHANHNTIAINMGSEFRNHLKGKSCRAYMSDWSIALQLQGILPKIQFCWLKYCLTQHGVLMRPKNA